MRLNSLLGLLQPHTARPDTAPPPQRPRMVLGGRSSPELCMRPMDYGFERPGFPWRHKRVTQLKADGICALYIDGRIVTIEGGQLDCALHCQPGLHRLEAAFGHDMMFHGEYVEEDGFNATIAAMQRREGQGVFWIHDALPLGSWVAGGSQQPIEERLELIRERLDSAESNFIGMLNWWMMDGLETQAKAAELWATGYEGLVSKEPGSPYVRDRSDMWLRIKRVITEDLPIIDVMADPTGALKAIVVRASSGPIKIGAGWDDLLGRGIVTAFDNATDALPMLAEVSYQLTTGAKRSVRGARFHRIRLDKRAAA